MARGLPTPTYEMVEQFGPDHAPRFRIVVKVEGLEPAEGTGSSKRGAEQDAAEPREACAPEPGTGVWTRTAADAWRRPTTG